jgi:acetoin utilization protein AcuB
MSGVDPRKVTIEDAMTSSVYSVEPGTPLDEVVATMGARKLGSAVIMQNGKVVGIFTTVDLCRAFTDLLQTRLTH